MEDDAVNVGNSQFSGSEGVLQRPGDAVSEFSSKSLEIGAGQLGLEVNLRQQLLEEAVGVRVGAENVPGLLSVLPDSAHQTTVLADVLLPDTTALHDGLGHEFADVVVNNDLVEAVSSESPVPASTQNSDFLNGLVVLADILDFPRLESQDGCRGGACAHVEDDVLLRLASIVDSGESPALCVIQTNRKTIRDQSHNVQSGEIGRFFNGPLLVGGVKGGNSDDSILHHVASHTLCVVLDFSQLHREQLLDAPWLLRIVECAASEQSRAQFTILLRLHSRIAAGVEVHNIALLAAPRQSKKWLQVREDLAGHSTLQRQRVASVGPLGVGSQLSDDIVGRVACRLEGYGGSFFAFRVLGQDDFEGNAGLDEGRFKVESTEVEAQHGGRC